MTVIQPGSLLAVEGSCDLLVVGVTLGNRLSASAQRIDTAMAGGLAEHLSRTRSLGDGGAMPFEGKLGQAIILPAGSATAARAFMVVGLGDPASISHREVRRAAGLAGRLSGRYPRVVVDLSDGVAGGARAAAEGFELGSYSFERYLSAGSVRSSEVVIAGADSADTSRAAATAGAVCWARDLVNEPPGNRGPEVFATLVGARAESAGLSVEILDEQALADQGMNGILSVGRGSASPPRFVVLSYEPEGATGFLGLVGKGITFDSGGLSIKTSEGMESMKLDCSGAAAAAAAICALPALGPKVKVVAALAVAENMPGGRAVKPGDVIRHYGGRTSEVLNTDAEGRLVLADALAWMAEQQPDAMVDLATLTGGMVVALGRKMAGVMSTGSELARQLLEASRRTDEPLWEMPLVQEYRALLNSPVADIKNISGSRYASPIIGGLFLKDFVGDTPWAHLDIAGPAGADRAEHYLAPGATGFGTRLLIDWIEHRAGRKADSDGD
ncbi:MAG: leucyl aminopeptidase [Actinomycetota bacterium]